MDAQAHRDDFYAPDVSLLTNIELLLPWALWLPSETHVLEVLEQERTGDIRF